MNTSANKSAPDYRLNTYKSLFLFACFLIVGILGFGMFRSAHPEQKASNCYVDTSAYNVQKYILYGKVSSVDTVYEEKCVVNK